MILVKNWSQDIVSTIPLSFLSHWVEKYPLRHIFLDKKPSLDRTEAIIPGFLVFGFACFGICCCLLACLPTVSSHIHTPHLLVYSHLKTAHSGPKRRAQELTITGAFVAWTVTVCVCVFVSGGIQRLCTWFVLSPVAVLVPTRLASRVLRPVLFRTPSNNTSSHFLC